MEDNLFDKALVWIVVLTFCTGIGTKIIGFTQIEPLRGKLDGYLIIDTHYIQAKDEVIPIESICKIQISNDDYYGKLTGSSKGNFGPALSNGTNNFVIIFLESGKTKGYQFELINSDDFQKVRTTLIDYHLMKKIDFWELAKVLGEKSTTEIAQLTKEISNRQQDKN